MIAARGTLARIEFRALLAQEWSFDLLFDLLDVRASEADLQEVLPPLAIKAIAWACPGSESRVRPSDRAERRRPLPRPCPFRAVELLSRNERQVFAQGKAAFDPGFGIPQRAPRVLRTRLSSPAKTRRVGSASRHRNS